MSEKPVAMQKLAVWIPEQMTPGTVFFLEEDTLERLGATDDSQDPYWAVLACPRCGTIGLTTRKQFFGLLPVICGSDECSGEFFIDGDCIVPRRPS